MLAEINGSKLYFDIEGMGLAPSGREMVEKPVCFVLHGGPGMDHSYFKPWLTPLAEDMQLVYIDHRGTGRSERAALETCTIDQMADDLEGLRNYLGLGKIVVLGNSFGGFWGLTYAVRHPESIDKLILVTTSPSHEFGAAADSELKRKGTPEQIKASPDLFEGRITNDADFMKWWEIMMPLYFHTWDDKTGGEMVARGKDSPQVAAYMFREVIPGYDVRPNLPAIDIPTLVLSGRHDWVTPVVESEAIADGIPGSKLVIFEESGHMPFIEEQDKFVRVVRDFIHQPA